MKTIFTTLFFFLFLNASLVFAIDWNQYHGRRSDNKTDERLTSTTWLEKSGSQKWKISTPLGFSSFSTEGPRAFTLIAEEDEDGLMREVCIALDTKSGKRLWSTWLCRMDYKSGGGNSGTPGNNGGDGPRSTPSVLNGKVWVYDSDMNLYCINAVSGKIIWDVRVLKEHNGQNIKWKNSSAPLIEGDLVIVYGGGSGQSLLAFQRDTGKLAWKTGDETATHATPIATTIHGLRQVIFFCTSGLVSVDPKSGLELWRQAFPFKVSTAASPVIAGDMIYCSAGYGVGAGLYKISRKGTRLSSSELWRKKNDMFNHWSTPLYHDGHLYGMFSFKKYGNGPLQCVELKSGKIKWSQDGYGPGNVILSGDYLIALADDGVLSLVKATPSKYTELARKKVLDGKCWSTPILSNGLVFARSTSEGVCLDAGKH
ncbi:MAG: PQQ-like beta-propeller repeat protein [Opitutales bacterium]|nr:PQQ-like beta-propeller repeat protein [Opitutales bacterium]